MPRFIPIILSFVLAGCALFPLRCSNQADADRVKSIMGQQAVDHMNREAAEGWIIDNYEAALAVAEERNAPVFVNFSCSACTNCLWMERKVFTLYTVKELFSHYVLVRLNTDRRDSINIRYRKMAIERFNTIDIPIYAIVSPSDSILFSLKFTSDTNKFISFLKKGLER